LIGYVDRFAAGPREVAVKVSSEFGDAYSADLVRIIHGDANPGRSRMTAEPRSGLRLRTTAGGAVFSVGSIMFCGSLSHNKYQATSRGCWKTFCGGSTK